MNKSRTSIYSIVTRIEPFDRREKGDQAEVLHWIESGAELFRRQKPDVPVRHLVSYVALVDTNRRSLLLMDHRTSGLWLPAGGHVEPEEDPYDTAVRELQEELGTKAAQVATVACLPLFITVTRTVGAGTHTDVSLWYVVSGDERMWLDVDAREFRGHRWSPLKEILATDIERLDPEMHRFVHKLQYRLESG